MGKKRNELIGPVTHAVIALSKDANPVDCARIRILLDDSKKFEFRRQVVDGVEFERWKASKEDALAFSQSLGADRQHITIDVRSEKTGKFHRISIEAEEDLLGPEKSVPPAT